MLHIRTDRHHWSLLRMPILPTLISILMLILMLMLMLTLRLPLTLTVVCHNFSSPVETTGGEIANPLLLKKPFDYPFDLLYVQVFNVNVHELKVSLTQNPDIYSNVLNNYTEHPRGRSSRRAARRLRESSTANTSTNNRHNNYNEQ